MNAETAAYYYYWHVLWSMYRLDMIFDGERWLLYNNSLDMTRAEVEGQT